MFLSRFTDLWVPWRRSGHRVGFYGSAVFVVSAAGCRPERECSAENWPTVDVDAAAGDYHVALVPRSVAVLTISGEEGLLYDDEVQVTPALERGEIVFSTTDPQCAAAARTGCSIVLKRILLRFSTVSFERSDASQLVLGEPELRVAAPVELQCSDQGCDVPRGTAVHTFLTTDGRRDHGVSPVSEPARLVIDAAHDILSFTGGVPLTFHVAGDECETVQGRLTLRDSGQQPWLQNPLSGNSGAAGAAGDD